MSYVLKENAFSAREIKAIDPKNELFQKVGTDVGLLQSVLRSRLCEMDTEREQIAATRNAPGYHPAMQEWAMSKMILEGLEIGFLELQLDLTASPESPKL